MRSARIPPASPPRVPNPAMRPISRLARRASKRSVTADQNPEIRIGPVTATCR